MKISAEKRTVILTDNDFSKREIGRNIEKIIANPDKFYLLSHKAEKKLCDAIDALSEESPDKGALTGINFAYDMPFAFKTSLVRLDIDEATNADSTKAEPVEVKSLQELLEVLEYSQNNTLAHKYRVIVDDSPVEKEESEGAKANLKKSLAGLFQQMAFLQLDMDIKLQSEIKKTLVKERFRANYKEVCAEIGKNHASLEKVLQTCDLGGEAKSKITKIRDAFALMTEEVQKAKERPIRIAAMGTKKAGKSVIINNLLGEEYAPTSSELPTPNCIIYKPDAKTDQKLKLEYVGQTLYFDTPKEMSAYIESEFKKAQKNSGEGSQLADMTIHYHSEAMSAFEILDTPGPNFAGAGEEHQKIAEECIKRADICIFVMNYSNHLTTDEVDFLEKIRNSFVENNKFYSLFIAINRIDERYAAEVEKSVTRIVDYIGGRLRDLGYENVVLFGVSALQNYYLQKAIALLQKDQPEFAGVFDVTAVRDLKKKYKQEMTALRFVEIAFTNIEDFHGYEGAIGTDLALTSGMPQLMRHCKYIGEQKADIEIVDNVVHKCNAQVDLVTNSFLVNNFFEKCNEQVEKIRELKEVLDDLKKKADEIITGVENLVSEEKWRSVAHKAADVLRSTKDSLAKEGVERIYHYVKDTPIREVINDENDKFNNEQLASLLHNFEDLVEFLQKTFDDNANQRSKVMCEENTVKIVKELQEAQKKIEEALRETQEKVEGSQLLKDFFNKFKFPTFPATLSDPIFSSAKVTGFTDIMEKVNKSKEKITALRERDAEGFWENVRSFFGKKYTELTFNVVEYKKKIEEETCERFRQQLNNFHTSLLESQEKEIKKFFDDIGKQCNDILAVWRDIFANAQGEVDARIEISDERRASLERDGQTIRNVESQIKPFLDLWGKINAD